MQIYLRHFYSICTAKLHWRGRINFRDLLPNAFQFSAVTINWWVRAHTRVNIGKDVTFRLRTEMINLLDGHSHLLRFAKRFGATNNIALLLLLFWFILAMLNDWVLFHDQLRLESVANLGRDRYNFHVLGRVHLFLGLLNEKAWDSIVQL